MTRDDAVAPTLRPITPEDEALLFAVYAGNRRDELAQVPWDAAQKEAFLAFQFKAQHQHYQDAFPRADFHIVLLDGAPVGRFYVDRRADEIRILDIALLLEHQGLGIGRVLLRDLLKEAEATSKSVSIYVERSQQHALRLFEDLGFEEQQDQGVSVLMVRTPGPGGAPV